RRADVAEDHPLLGRGALLGRVPAEREAAVDDVADELEVAALIVDPRLAPKLPIRVEDRQAQPLQAAVRPAAGELLVDDPVAEDPGQPVRPPPDLSPARVPLADPEVELGPVERPGRARRGVTRHITSSRWPTAGIGAGFC